MKLVHSFAAAVFITTGVTFPAFAQDAGTQAVLAANQQAAVLQTQQYNEQVNNAGAGLTGNPSYCQAYGTCKNNSPHDDSGAIDLNPLIFGLLQQEPTPVVAAQEMIPAPHHRYHHRRKHVAARLP